MYYDVLFVVTSLSHHHVFRMIASFGTVLAIIWMDKGASVKPVCCCVWTLVPFAEKS
jgi:hypothetical protein